MHFRAPGFQRAVIAAAALALGGLVVSCGYKAPSQQRVAASNVKFRAFVSQDVSLGPSTAFPGGVPAGLFVIDASQDLRAPAFVSTSNLPGLLVLAPNRKLTLAYSSADNSVAIVNNATESSSGAITLTGSTESIAISPDASTAYAAVNNAPVFGQSPGAVEVMNLNTGNIPVTIPVPSAHYLAESHNGNRLLVFSDNSDTVTVIATSNVPACTPLCQSPDVISTIAGFDHPVGALFSSDDNIAYVLNCGPECGGLTASIQAVDMTTQNLRGTALPVDAATIGLMTGNTLYVAGTPPTAPGNVCSGAATAAPTCGRLDVVNLSSMTVTSSQVITDGYHNRIDLSDNGQLFVGARNCTSINNPGTEVRGCLSIFNTINPGVVIPPDNNDVTGIQAIKGRNVMYVVENGELRIYDTTTDKLGPTQIDISGQAIDVKLVDF
jgi:hypothetical protein